MTHLKPSTTSHAMANAGGDYFYPDSGEDAAWFWVEHEARPVNAELFPFWDECYQPDA